MSNSNFVQTSHFAPPGMIPEFNELGNHPRDMKEFVCTQVRDALGRLGIGERGAEVEGLLLRGVDHLLAAPSNFSGRHTPSPATLPIKSFMQEAFVRSDLCRLTGGDNYGVALDLLAAGHNIVLTPNHTSPLDGLIPVTLFDKEYNAEPPSLIMSQVFEYARITRLLTSGVRKYPVFQPKHMERFVNDGQTGVVREMYNQNTTTMRTLHADGKKGGQNVFLYLERDRNSDGMGIPEPSAVRVLEMVERAKPGMFVVPMHIAGAETIFPSIPGKNEIDNFMQTVQVGYGDVVCGKPIRFSEVLEVVDSINQQQVIASAMGDTAGVLENSKQSRLASIAIVILGLVADLAPSEAAQGVYRNMPRFVR